MNIETQIIQYLKINPDSSSSTILEEIDSEKSLATLKRVLTNLINEKIIETIGKEKATKYRLSKYFKLFENTDIETYYSKEIDEREIKKTFDISIIQDLLPNVDLLLQSENVKLENLQNEYSKNISDLTNNEYNKELER